MVAHDTDRTELVAGFDSLLIEVSERLRASIPAGVSADQYRALCRTIVTTIEAARDGVNDIR